MTDQTNKPNYRNRAHAAMARGWKIVRDVMRGTLHLRDLGQEYLPKFPAEHDAAYKDRLKSAAIFNVYSRTVQGLVGMAFKKNPTLSDDVPEVIRGNDKNGIEGHAENIDLAGTHLDVFARDVLEDALVDGHAFILVDMQRARQGTLTLEDELKQNLRPYWARYKACQAVNFRPITINGQLEIGQITFEEEICVEAGEYGEREVKRYRTFRLVPYADLKTQEIRYQVYWLLQQKSQEPGREETFITVGEGVIKNFNRIPVAVVYGRKTGFLTSQPPLLDLALLNLKYYQKRSDYDESLHKAGFPIPVFAGVPEDWNMLVVGAGFGIKLPTNATATYMEPTGGALEASRLDLQDLRSEMAALGLSVLAARPQVQAKTATETVIDFTQESSELEIIARSAQDAFELCLQFHAQYLGLKSGGSITLGAHLKSLRLTQAQVQAYSAMEAASQLSKRTFWEILEQGDALPDTFEAEREEQRLKDQQKSLGESLLKDFDKGDDEGTGA